jgi:hypothetical protein
MPCSIKVDANGMDNITLQVWSVIGTWVAGLGTLAAVVVSLWIALHQSRVKLEVGAGHRLLITPGSQEKPEYCLIRVVNVGLRPAKITHVGWEIGKGKNRKYMLQSFGFPESDSIPKTLQEGEEANFMIPLNYANANDDWIIRFPKYLAEENSSKSFSSLKVTVNTSVGQTFKRKVEENLIRKLEESYKAQQEQQ